MKYNENVIEDYIEKLENDPYYWDENLSIEYCIAFKLKQISAAFDICDNLIDAYKRGVEQNNFFEANFQSMQLGQKSLNNPEQLSDFFQLFLIDRKKTRDLFLSINNKLTPIKADKNINSDDFENYGKFEYSKFDDEVMQLRYFQEKKIRNFYWGHFSKKLELLSKDDATKTFAYFLNTHIDISEKFYQSNYIQNKTGINDVEKALIKYFLNETNITWFSGLKTKIKNFFKFL